MAKPIVKIKCQNGISFDSALTEIFNELTAEYDFVETADDPDFILFGPYGNDIPAPASYTRIGYFCENIIPDLSICEWAFGIPREEDINDSHYKRIQWHGLDPAKFVKPDGYDARQILNSKKYFCNFLYSNPVPYREEFFKQLSKYKTVDAPGRSMNNMESIDKKYKGDIWECKRQFLSEYKFTIAFENYVYPGYQTEKLYDAMQANSIPIYCGDAFIGDIFNTGSFINANEYINVKSSGAISWLQKNARQDFIDIRPQFYNNPLHRVKRKLKAVGRNYKMNLQFDKLNFQPLIERIIELDNDDDKYLQMLQQPWLNNNSVPAEFSLKQRWVEIFNTIK
ncbi:MAG: hypothetical protein EOP47_27150 [Sphingobacteriaceae bacterium]|nr:MAG: hypothetical protein EOP47_27150 [Sphingobacteriaceae bacterium]